MFKKLLTFLIGFLCITQVYAALDRSFITFTNNTNEKVSIQTTLATDDADFKRGSDWDGLTLDLKPYETKQVLWFSRLQNVKPNKYYCFNLFTSRADHLEQALLVSFLEKSGLLFGSELTTDLTLPGQLKQRIFNQDGLYQFSGDFWNEHFTIYGLSRLPLGSLYNSFHIVIAQQEKNTVQTSAANQISILSYNTQLMPFYAGVVDDLNQPSVRVQDIPKKINDYDVVVLEELFDRDLRNTMIKLMEVNYPYHTSVVGQNTSRFLTGGVMIFSKWPIQREDQFVYHAASCIDRMAAKGAIYAAINKQGKIYHIIGTHMQAAHKHESILTREWQLQELHDFINNLHIPADEPLLIGGDFNIDQFNHELETLLNTLHVSLLDNIGYRYSTDSDVNTMSPEKYRARIDYIFYSNNHAKPTKAFNNVFVLRDFNNITMWPKFDLSDHFPVAGYFEFK